MIDLIKAYWQLAMGLLIALALAFASYSLHHHGYMQGMAELDLYKANIAQQVVKAQANADKIQHDNEVKYAQAQSDYKRDTSILANRLRDFKPLLCGEEQTPVRVDGRSSASLPTEGQNPTRVTHTFAPSTSIRPTFSYSDALRDTQQCSALIEFVKGN